MRKTRAITSINIKSYLAIMDQADDNRLQNPRDLPALERRLVEELLREGLLSDLSEEIMPGLVNRERIAITPAGAVAIEAWRQHVREASIAHKLSAALVRFLWLFVGFALALAGEVLREGCL